MQTVSGQAFDLVYPRADMVRLMDIAAGLSRLPRFCGQTTGPVAWNVAEHSLLVERLVEIAGGSAELRLAALIHDAHEAYIGDVISPLKSAIRILLDIEGRAVFDPIAEISARISGAVHAAFAVPWPLSEAYAVAIKRADLQALRIEHERFQGPAPHPWTDLPDAPEIGDLAPQNETFSRERWNRRVLTLLAQRAGPYPHFALLSVLDAEAPPG
ncbi:hypothetical protein [Limobrevibacterium gyesilva]|uniref:Phosphohydrolase n=1 Tax=Limobrevibacterium gyesilva TaxID=2991712 RepID=A0AA41YPN7_9PROT|nr:hypothetical protein [Limobrevibacterium gyesilva]MCW3477399.1 hypothetical protein [Limobrevibacterium gyesilva]